MTCQFLFFDTETTGLPRNWRAPMTQLDNWPRMVQLAWMVCDDLGAEWASASRIIRPDGYSIPADASRIHGITTQKACAEGIPLADALAEILPHLATADFIVAHNISFDENILGSECLRMGLPNPFAGKSLRCTMRESTEFCGIPGHYGLKFPTLTELHRLLFNTAFDGAHDALADVRACKACFYELRRRRVLA